MRGQPVETAEYLVVVELLGRGPRGRRRDALYRALKHRDRTEIDAALTSLERVQRAVIESFELRISYDRAGGSIRVSATVTEAVAEALGTAELPSAPVAQSFIAGAGLIPNPATVDGPRTRAIVHRIEESCRLGEPAGVPL